MPQTHYYQLNALGREIAGAVIPRTQKPVNGDWISGMDMAPRTTLQTMKGEATPSYPVGVFNIDKKYLGIATNATDYETLWNADPANRKASKIKAVSPTALMFHFTGNAAPKLFGLRYFQFEAQGRPAFVCHKDAYVDLGDGIIKRAGDIGVTTAFSMRTFYGYGAYPGYSQMYYSPVERTDQIAVNSTVANAVGAGTWSTVRVFHSEWGAVLMTDKTGSTTNYVNGLPNSGDARAFRNLSGKLPRHCSYIGLLFHNMTTSNMRPINAGFEELDNLQMIFYGSYGGGATLRTDFPVDIDKQLAILQSIELLIGNHSIDSFGITRTKCPRLKSLVYGYGAYYSGATPKPMTNFLADLPAFIDHFDLNNCSLTAAEVDALYNAFDPVAPVPREGKFLASYFNAAPTAASATSRANLMAKGYTV